MKLVSSLPQALKLRSAIASYAVITGHDGSAKTICPRPGATLALSLAGSCLIDGVRTPRAAVVGVRQRPVQLVVEPITTDRIQVQFHPCGLRFFSSLRASVLVDRIVPAETIFPDKAVACLMHELAATPGWGQRIAILDRFFEGLFTRPSSIESALAEVTRRICEEPDVPLGALLRKVPASLRHTERLFTRLVGVSPRTLQAIARFDRAKDRILTRNDRTLTEVGLAAGYYDQAHFGREFRRLASMAPGSYTACPRPLAD